MSRIFLSHVEEDLTAMQEFARGLEDRGYATWYFERDVLPGASYLLQITQAIENSDAIVLIASEDALSSDQVTKEVVGAFERGIPFFPILIDITPPELKERQPEWRHALGGTAMITVGQEGLGPVIAQVAEGLKAISIKPGGGKAPSPTPVLSTPKTPTPKHLTEKFLAARSMEGERKQVTVLFADVAGFTSISEKLDPEEVHDLISPAVDIMTEEIHTYEGTIAQFLGDGLMALFGAPIAHEDSPKRAIYASLAIQERLSSYADELKDKGIAFNMRIGINTGLVIVGRIGDDLTMEYTALGDTVNLASRMESSARPGTVQVAEDTYRRAQGYFDFEDLGTSEVKGKEKPVRSYRVISPRPARTRVEASLPKGLSHFVGRKRELEHLSDCFFQAKDGAGQVVGIVGEPGVGKSRLVLEFIQSLPSEDYTYLEGGCLHYGEAMAYRPILDILRSYFDIHEGESESSIREKIEIANFDGHLTEILSPLQEILSLSVDDEEYSKLEPQVRRQMVFEAIRYLLTTESQRCPLILAVEDLHWVDKTSEEFLTYFVDGLTGSSILLILLYRPEYTAAWTSKTYCSEIRVDQLPKRTSAELVASILSEGDVDPEISELIVTRTAGNPLFIEEFTHSLIENGSIVKDNEHYTLSSDPADIQVPDTIQGIIASRLDRLEETSKRIVQVASVIGREFAYRLLATVTTMQEELKSYLTSLQSLEFIYEKSLFPELEYIFKHALTQEVAYNSLLLKRRKELHGRIGQAIEDLYADRLEDFYEMLAYHYSRSTDTEKALAYLKLSGAKAARNLSNWEAIRFYKEAIKLLDAQPETEETKRNKLKVYISINAPLAFLSYPEGSGEILEKAERLAEGLGDEVTLSKVYSTMAFYHTAKGNTSLAVKYSEKCFDKAEKTGAVDLMAKTAPNFCFALFWAGDVLKAADISRRALQLLEEQHREKDLYAGGFTTYASLCGFCVMALGSMGEFEEARAVFEKGLKNAHEANDTFGIGFVECCHTVPSYFERNGDDLIDHARKAIEYYEETGVEILLGYVWSALGVGHCFLGDHETAREYGEKGINIQKEVGWHHLIPFQYHLLAIIHLAAGDLESARKCAEESLKLSREFKQKFVEGIAMSALGRIVGGADPSQIDVAEQYISQGISISDELKLKPLAAQGYIFLGEVFELAGRREAAVDNLKKAEAMGEKMGMGYWLDRTSEALARLESAPSVD